MIDFSKIFGKYTSSKKGKAEQVVVNRGTEYVPHYGNDLLCARYYNFEETKYIDLYIPLKGPVGIWLSGGADSSLCAYLLAKTIKDYNLNIKILPMSFKRDDKPWNLWTASNIIEKIEEILNIKRGDIFLNHNFCDFGDYKLSLTHGKKLKNHITSLKDNKLVTLVYNGLTHNPVPIPPELEDKREICRDITIEEFIDENTKIPNHHLEEEIICKPFLFIDKAFLASLYKKHDLLESLFPYTRSCEGFAHDTKFFRESCKRCWWCKERNWAFAKYTEDPYKHIIASERLRKMCVAV
jgi:hypothetical protein